MIGKKSNKKQCIGKINKFGRKLSISLLIQSALHFRKAHKQLDTWYLTKSKAKGRGKMRMGLVRKMKAYDSFLEKKGILIKNAA